MAGFRPDPRSLLLGSPNAGTPIAKAAVSAVFAAISTSICPRAPAPCFEKLALPGGLPIKVGDDVVGAVGVSGSPGKDDDCSKAGIDKVADQLK